ncbi:MAG: uracil-DNA glycosylase [Bacteroidota bacterium]
MVAINPKIDESWKTALAAEFDKPYFNGIKDFLISEKSKFEIFPPGAQIFAAFNHTPFNSVKAVILGQDPYHGRGQANGLSFSVADGVRKPPSLVNIFEELKDDLGIPICENGNLEKWTGQGVLLLNASLTVRANTPMSHSRIGWEIFTDAVIKAISDQRKGVVFLLWGKFAQSKDILIDTTKHVILKAAHPSPYSARNGFFGCKHFSKTNEILDAQGIEPIDWSLA